jgi:tetratricopeptide (TPR) repeat protein
MVRMSALRALFLAIVLPFACSTYANFKFQDVKKVPLKRLIGNLEKKQKSSPKDPKLLGHLARAFSMAYAAGLSDNSVVEKFDNGEILLLQGSFSPLRILPFADPRNETNEKDRSKTYLNKAISYYRKAFELDKTDLPTMLGLAWCLEKLGKKDEAMKLYREVIAEAWKEDGKRESGGVWGVHFISEEAAGYLMALLDPKADEKEIADLKQKVDHLNGLPRGITPIAIPLRDNLSLAGIVDKNGVIFDLDGSGRMLRWQWLKPVAAWLVYDYDGLGQIDSAIQMFGNRTFMLFLQHGYESMSLLDDDGNGWLEGRELGHLALWQDLNGNGISEPGDVLPLSAWGIKALSCHAERRADGEWFSPEGVIFEDGSMRPTYDLILRPRQ